MTALRRGIFTAALTVGLLAGTAGVADADVLAVTDPRGDVVSFAGESETQTPEPGVRNGDILRTVLRHGTSRISVRVKFAELLRVGDFRSDVVRVVTNEGVRRNVVVEAGPGVWRGTAEMARPNGAHVDCAVSHTIDYDLNVVTVSFPRRCVSDPRWVQLGAGAVWAGGDFKVFADDGLKAGTTGSNLTLSPRLRRG